MRMTRKHLELEILKKLEETDHVGLVFPDPFVCRVGRGRTAVWVFTWGDPVRLVECCPVIYPDTIAREIARRTVVAAIEREQELQWMRRM